MYRWFRKPSFTYLEKKTWILWATYSNQFEIFTDHFACTVTSAWQKIPPHIYYEKYSEANLFKKSGCFWNDSDQNTFSKHRK